MDFGAWSQRDFSLSLCVELPLPVLSFIVIGLALSLASHPPHPPRPPLRIAVSPLAALPRPL